MKKLFSGKKMIFLLIVVMSMMSLMAVVKDGPVRANEFGSIEKGSISNKQVNPVVENRNREVIYEQGVDTPDAPNIFTKVSDDHGVAVAFDNFSNVEGRISGVNFYGKNAAYTAGEGWVDGDEDPMDIHFIFYEDNSGAVGDQVAEFTVELTRTFAYNYLGNVGYYWEATFPGFVNLSDGWISIRGATLSDPDSQFMWISSSEGDGTSYTYYNNNFITESFDFNMQLIGTTIEDDAPAASLNLTAVADAAGALEAELSWTNPSETFGGVSLTELTAINILRNDVLIHTITDPVIGAESTYTDVVTEAGDYSYKVVGVNTIGDGLPAILSNLWIGEDVPAAVSNLAIADLSGSAVISWENPVAGMHNGPFNEAITGYHIERSDATVFEVSGIATEYTDDTITGNGYYSYSVQAINAAGDGDVSETEMFWIGDLFSGIIVLDLAGSTGTTLATEIEALYDGEVVVASSTSEYPYTEAEAVFVLLGIYSDNHTLSTSEATPLVTYLSNGGNVYMEGGDCWAYDSQTALHDMFSINGLDDGAGNLGTVLGNDFLAGSSWNYSGTNSYMDTMEPAADGVTLFTNDSPAYVCGVSNTTDVYKTVGTSFEITGLNNNQALAGILGFFEIIEVVAPGTVSGMITLENGAADVTEVEVSVASVTVNPDVDGNFELQIYPGTYTVSATLAGYETAEQIDVVVETAEVTTVNLNLVYIPDALLAPESLSISSITDNSATLNWNAPGSGNTIFADDFEAYDDFVIDFAPWTCVDADLSETYGFQGIEWANAYAAMAYIIFNPTATTPAMDDLVAHSGNKLAACFASTDNANDDWMITPQMSISADNQLSFWAKSYTDEYGMERFNVGISTTGTNPADFTIISGSPYEEAPATDWTEFTYDLSAYAGQDIYVGIQCVSSDAFIFLLDDISVGVSAANFALNTTVPAKSNFVKATGTTVPADFQSATSTRSRSLLGYNVYLNDMTTPVAENIADLSYDFTNLSGATSFTAGVCAVYTDGVSEIVTVDFDLTGVTEDEVGKPQLLSNYPNPFNPNTTISFTTTESGANATIVVYNSKGQKVKTLLNETLNAGNHTVNWNGTDDNNKAVTSGVYFYKMNSSNLRSIKKMILMK